MKIGILTFHKPINYGAFLQSYSLSQRLKKEFPNDDIEIIDYIAPKERRRILINILRDVKHGGIIAGGRSIKKYCIFHKSQKYLPLSKKSFCTKNLSKLFSYINQNYDCLVIGSDAIFNWRQTDFPTAFIPNYKFDIPVLTYAASVHGLKYYDVEKEKIDVCKRAFSKMSFIGVRDECTAKFVNYCNPDVSPQFCCDPTFFIDKQTIEQLADNYLERIKHKYNFSLEKKYIVIMAPDSSLTKSVAEKYRNEYSIVTLFKNSKYADVFLYDLNPFEWAMVLRGASATITSYFHGTLLSLVQETPVIVLDYSGYDEKYQGKLNDLLNVRLNIPEFYFNKKYAVAFNNQNDFFELFQKMLNREYTDEINERVNLVKEGFQNFIGVLTRNLGDIGNGEE